MGAGEGIMARASVIGKLRSLKFKKPRWGIRGSLFAAFAVIAGMAILISAGSGLILGQLGAMMLNLSGRDIPRLAVSLQLATESQNLAGQGPALLASGSADALKDRSRKMKETQQVALRKLGQIIELGSDKAIASAMGETLKSIDDTTTSLGTAAQERLALPTQPDRPYEALRKAQDAFVAVAAPAMMDAQARMNAVLAPAN